jgi:hypothetical protein
MTSDDLREAAAAKLKRGEWLTAPEVALVLRISKRTALRMMVSGRIESQTRPGAGTLRQHRVAKPSAVRELLKGDAFFRDLTD